MGFFQQQIGIDRERKLCVLELEAAFITQDAESYQKLLDKAEAAEGLESIRRGLAQSFAGEERPLESFQKEFEKKYGL